MNPATPQPARISTDRLRELRQWTLNVNASYANEVAAALDELIAAREAAAAPAVPPTSVDIKDFVDAMNAGKVTAICCPSLDAPSYEEIAQWEATVRSAPHSSECFIVDEDDIAEAIALMRRAAVPPTSDEVEAAIERLIGTARHCELWKDHRDHAPRMERLEEARQRIRDLCRGAQQPLPHETGMLDMQWMGEKVRDIIADRNRLVERFRAQQPAPSELLRAAANILKDLDEAFAAGRGFYPAFSPGNVGALRAALEAERRKL